MRINQKSMKKIKIKITSSNDFIQLSKLTCIYIKICNNIKFK